MSIETIMDPPIKVRGRRPLAPSPLYYTSESDSRHIVTSLHVKTMHRSKGIRGITFPSRLFDRAIANLVLTVRIILSSLYFALCNLPSRRPAGKWVVASPRVFLSYRPCMIVRSAARGKSPRVCAHVTRFGNNEWQLSFCTFYLCSFERTKITLRNFLKL